MEWINIEDKMPEIGKPCLLYQTYPRGTMFNLRADPLQRTNIRMGGMNWEKKFITYENQYGENYLKYVTHWMPLPLSPTEDDNPYHTPDYEI